MPVVGVMELVGDSHKSWEDAVHMAVAEAAKINPNISGVEVTNWTAKVKNGQLTDFHANVKVAYVSDGSH